MIYFYSGTPGSGKSLEVAKDIVNKLVIRKQNVVSTVNINTDKIFYTRFMKKRKKTGVFYHIPIYNLTPEYLIDYAFEHHLKGVEGQTLLVIDEAQLIFSPTAVKSRTMVDRDYRQKWLDFFTQHRHFGYNIIIVSQFDRLIDPQIRCLFEYNVIHRKVNNFKIGFLLSIFKISLFISVHYWYTVNERISSNFFLYSKKYNSIYDSYARFDKKEKLKNESKKCLT